MQLSVSFSVALTEHLLTREKGISDGIKILFKGRHRNGCGYSNRGSRYVEQSAALASAGQQLGAGSARFLAGARSVESHRKRPRVGGTRQLSGQRRGRLQWLPHRWRAS